MTRYRYNDCPLDSYACRHGLGYTVLKSVKNGLQATQEIFVPVEDPCELTRVTLTNQSSEAKDVSLFSYVEFCLWNAMDDMSNFQRNYSIGEVEVEGSTIYHKTEYRERRNHYAVFHANRGVDGYDTTRDSFCGPDGGLNAPQRVLEGRSGNSAAHGWQPIGSHHLKFHLEPGESLSTIFLLGYCEVPREEKFIAPNVINKKPAHAMIEKYATDSRFDAALSALQADWESLLGTFRVETPEEGFNRMVNLWNQYQCMVTFNMSRSASYYESGLGRGMGFRDSCQDLLGFVHMCPDRARQRILDIAATQLPDGSAYHQYQPLTKQGNSDIGGGFNDDPLWLIAAVCAYIRETGDMSILDERCDFDNDSSLAAPLMEHLRRSFRFTCTHKGPHGLPLIGRADWNDCLNLNCFSEEPGESFQTFGPSEGPVAESVFIAGMFVKYGTEYADLCQRLGLTREAEDSRDAVSQVYQAAITAGWDGEWFLRAYDAASQPVGSAACDEGKIFIEPQGMCVMAGIGVEEGLAQRALRSVETHLDTEFGIVLLDPPYTYYRKELGEITSYPPGYKENAGIFCHNNPWVSCAETVLGHGDRAFEIYRKTCPAYLQDVSEIHRTEPYVYSQMVAGKGAPTHGEGKNSWLTGTAAWTFVNASQYILGIQPSMDGLCVNPCIPSGWRGFTCLRRYRGCEYHITVENRSGSGYGVKEMYVDGKPVSGCCIPPSADGARHNVAVVL